MMGNRDNRQYEDIMDRMRYESRGEELFNDISWGEATVLWLCLVVVIAVLAATMPVIVNGSEVNEEVEGRMVGIWKEIFSEECIDAECLVVYYSDNTFEQYMTYLANAECWVGAVRINDGESLYEMLSGTWWAENEYIHYNVQFTTNRMGFKGGRSDIRILSMEKDRVSFRWDNGTVCEAYRIGGLK